MICLAVNWTSPVAGWGSFSRFGQVWLLNFPLTGGSHLQDLNSVHVAAGFPGCRFSLIFSSSNLW